MMLTPKQVVEIVEAHADKLAVNAELIDIYENNLTQYIDDELRKQLSPESYSQARMRLCPINILPKIIDKLTNIYQGAVSRMVVGGTKTDEQLVEYYVDMFDMNDTMNSANELYNLCRSTILYPTIKSGKPTLLYLRNDRVIPYAADPECPTKMTHLILIYKNGPADTVYFTWSDESIMASDSTGRMRPELLAAIGNPDGLNPFGVLPFVYPNDSKFDVMPAADIDALKIVKLLPVQLTDLNLAAMYQSFSVLYGINIDEQDLKMMPNAFLRFKSDPSSDKEPKIGVIKPEVDYEQVLKLIETELSMWLGTKGVRASTVGGLSQDNYASGISKIIDEMDTFEARQKQVTVFKKTESQLWDLIINYIHPYWVSTGVLNAPNFTPGIGVNTEFAVQLPMQSRGVIIKDLKEEYAAGFISLKRAIAKANPEKSEKEVLELIAEIEAERSGRMELEAPTTVEVEDDASAES